MTQDTYSHTWVTVHADASYSQQTGQGTWAVWVKTAAGRVVLSGECPDYIKNAHHAELAAIYAGIHLAVANFPHVGGILVRSDCQPALRDVEKIGVPDKNSVITTLREKIAAAAGGRTIRTKWVKGHNGGGTRESWVNNACDRMARAARLKKAKT